MTYKIMFDVVVHIESLESPPTFKFVVPVEFQADDLDFHLHHELQPAPRKNLIVVHRINENTQGFSMGRSKFPLKMIIKIPNSISWWDSVNKILLTLESQCPQKKTFSYHKNGSSTSLGRFNISSVEVGIIHHIRTLEIKSKELKPTKCLLKKEQGNAELDIGEWEYNTFLKSFVCETTLGELLNQNVCFQELFSGAFLNAIPDIGDYKFINNNHLYINIDVCSPTDIGKLGQKAKRFAFEVKPTFSTRCYDKEYMKQDHRCYRAAEVIKNSKNVLMEKSLTL
ncbi:unnamed protein product [Ambrosiozyma monospora]|uniref:Unnamed protein product n=1 Tax=Ambrosiozyma monospora TaxID=43982 RepID=A0A9W6SXW7_AMBMO|nr:unnamed protein product [Ambrosiozyma monospora]